MAAPLRFLVCGAFILVLLFDAASGQPKYQSPYLGCVSEPFSSWPYCNTSLSVNERVADLISRLKPSDKPGQLLARSSQPIPEIGLPEYNWGFNAVHGDGNIGCLPSGVCTTSFPNPPGLGATFNMSVVYGMAQIVIREYWAFFNLGLISGGLDTWSPNLNMNRDPRWGRNQEVPGEDPFLTTSFGLAYVNGLQNGSDPRYIQGVSSIKHFMAYSVEHDRYSFNSVVPAYDLADTYSRSFEAAIREAGALGVMCSYNALNGIPMCAHPTLETPMRSVWGFDGYVSSDSGAVEYIYTEHKYANSLEDAVADAINAGTDIDSMLPDDINKNPYYKELGNCLADGKVNMSVVDRALNRTYTLRFRLGIFDPNSGNEYFNFGPEIVNNAQAKQAQMEAALQSMVLLQNNNNTLPFKKGINLAVIGPNANNASALMGNYLGQICPNETNGQPFPCVSTVLDGLAAANNAAGGTTTYVLGCAMSGSKIQNISDAVAAAQQADAVVLVLGLDQTQEAEYLDRTQIGLPGLQAQLGEAVIQVGKPTVVVLVNGGSVSIDPLVSIAPAVLEAFYPSYAGAAAIAQVIFGDYNPGGKLPVTIYPAAYASEIPMTDFSMSAAPGRSYRYYLGNPLYPFGFGLSYTTFSLSLVSGPKTVKAVDGERGFKYSNQYTLMVTNTGNILGDEVVQLYVSANRTSFLSNGMPPINPTPFKALKGFQRVTLAAGASTNVVFNVDETAFYNYNTDGDRVVWNGQYTLIFTRGHGEEIEVTVDVTSRDGKAWHLISPSVEVIGKM